ncbi:hypothetical protein [Halococcus sediminicola]|uniref:hypothetical protein n=1 Tax=Halococcus sediminicola TaxID=1264579 RepID=UPI000A6A3137|nr:hypothetical protein [Halococcus sediminicola]
MSDPPSDVVDEDNEMVCPFCGSIDTEIGAGDGLDYRCHDCDATFDPSSGPVNVE